MIIKDSLFTTRFTCVECEEKDNQNFNAPHHFKVRKIDPVTLSPSDEIVGEINFQEGPVKENGVNGLNHEDLLLMVLIRLRSFQESEYACRENEKAIEKLEECVMWLRKRTLDREQRNVLGTSEL